MSNFNILYFLKNNSDNNLPFMPNIMSKEPCNKMSPEIKKNQDCNTLSKPWKLVLKITTKRELQTFKNSSILPGNNSMKKPKM